jgi:hypothetical protein
MLNLPYEIGRTSEYSTSIAPSAATPSGHPGIRFPDESTEYRLPDVSQLCLRRHGRRVRWRVPTLAVQDQLELFKVDLILGPAGVLRLDETGEIHHRHPDSVDGAFDMRRPGIGLSQFPRTLQEIDARHVPEDHERFGDQFLGSEFSRQPEGKPTERTMDPARVFQFPRDDDIDVLRRPGDAVEDTCVSYENT